MRVQVWGRAVQEQAKGLASGLVVQAVFSLSTFDQSRSEGVESMSGHFRLPGAQLDGLLLFWLRHHDMFCS